MGRRNGEIREDKSVLFVLGIRRVIIGLRMDLVFDCYWVVDSREYFFRFRYLLFSFLDGIKGLFCLG